MDGFQEKTPHRPSASAKLLGRFTGSSKKDYRSNKIRKSRSRSRRERSRSGSTGRRGRSQSRSRRKRSQSGSRGRRGRSRSRSTNRSQSRRGRSTSRRGRSRSRSRSRSQSKSRAGGRGNNRPTPRRSKARETDLGDVDSDAKDDCASHEDEDSLREYEKPEVPDDCKRTPGQRGGKSRVKATKKHNQFLACVRDAVLVGSNVMEEEYSLDVLACAGNILTVEAECPKVNACTCGMYE